MKNVGEKVGEVVGAVMVGAVFTAADAAGHHPSVWVVAASVLVSTTVGGWVGKAMSARPNQVVQDRNESSGAVMALARVLQLLNDVDKGIAEAVDSINMAQAYFQRASAETRSDVLESANRLCRQAPSRFEEGMQEIRTAQDLVGEHLVAVAKAGTA